MAENEITRVGIWPPLKNHQRAYVISGAEASDLADLAGVEADLNLAASACRIAYSRGGSPSTDVLRRACIDTALMRYRRCFTTGRRTRLTEDDVQSFDEEKRNLHDLIIFVANKCIAHSVDGSEQSLPYVLVENDHKSSRFNSRIRTCTTQPSHYNMLPVMEFEVLCLQVRDVAHGKAELLAESLALELRSHPPSYLTSLPEVAEIIMDRDDVLTRWEAEALAAGKKRRREAAEKGKR